MKSSIIIGDKSFKYKKDALAHYKSILSSYNFGESLNDEHFDDVIDLFDYGQSFHMGQDIENADETITEKKEKRNNSGDTPTEDETELLIEDIRIAKAQYDSKCFEIIFNDSSTCLVPYLFIISRPKNDPIQDFNKACRNAIQNDLRLVKLRYFQLNSNKGLVKCQETGELNKWVDLVVDHRQPNTFSIIVDRFKEVRQIDLNKVEYCFDDLNKLVFKDQSLMLDFKNYHKEKANLRIVKKERNLSRTGMARIKTTNNDLKIE